MKENSSRVVMEADEIQRVLERLARGIMEKSQDSQKLALVGIHTGGVHLARRIQSVIREKFALSVPVGSLDINLYRD
ncbi:MAG TPA: bifunctional pyr operon transcriptional regulator/uracil phosphoribosyltransferase, partial [Syntrophobacteraceae bacterium]|nr:bifunctional pyr operon transcriptional regulator/uracil phosphoribosyltransferase [Syntrophobacteraceae bacterium]